MKKLIKKNIFFVFLFILIHSNFFTRRGIVHWIQLTATKTMSGSSSQTCIYTRVHWNKSVVLVVNACCIQTRYSVLSELNQRQKKNKKTPIKQKHKNEVVVAHNFAVFAVNLVLCVGAPPPNFSSTHPALIYHVKWYWNSPRFLFCHNMYPGFKDNFLSSSVPYLNTNLACRSPDLCSFNEED